jgi:predicted acyl esterase
MPAMPVPLSIALDHDVPLPLRDGTVTRADVWRPADGPPRPAILTRTPYLKEGLAHQAPIDPRQAISRGYAFVVQDVRGKGTSEGAFDPFVNERSDGFDSVEWVAAQPWCDGRVVMVGASYVGATQWLAASTRPPALKAIAPVFSTDGYGEGWSFRSGVLEQGFLGTWIAANLAPDELQWPDDLERSFTDVEGLVEIAPWSRGWFSEPADSPYWAERSVTGERERIEIPILHVAGWYDCFLAGTLRSFRDGRRSTDRLIIGPWEHGGQYGDLVGERAQGSASDGARYGLGARILDFYDAVLAGREPASPAVHAYRLGARRWDELETWPPPARTVTAGVGAGSFDVDPADLPPTLGGRALLVALLYNGGGVMDQTRLTGRADVLALPLADVPAGASLGGPVTARLHVAATGGETRDWVVTLCVRRTDGALDNLSEGIARQPTDADAVEVELGDVYLQLQEGETLVALVAGGSFPRWSPPASPGHQEVLAGSSIELPVLDG